VRIESGPGVDIAFFQRGATVRVLQVHQFHVVFFSPACCRLRRVNR
jgi:hypothetical protein